MTYNSQLKFSNCFYFAVSRFFSNYKISYDELTLFLLFGGYTFDYRVTNNNLVPTFVIKGNIIDDTFFNSATGHTIHRKKFNDPESAIKETIEMVQNNNIIIIATNSYFLPFDKVNYLNNFGKHYLIVKSYNPQNQSFSIEDINYSGELQKDLLFKALERNSTGDVDYISFTINKNECNLEDNQLLLQSNFKEYKKSKIENILSFREEILKTNKITDELFKKITYRNIAKVLRHPHGPIAIRKLIKNYIIQKKLADEFNDLANLWSKLSNYFLKAMYNKVTLNEVIQVIDEIYEKEVHTTNLIIKEENLELFK